MVDTPYSEDKFGPFLPVKPEKLAWGVLVVSFGLFCVICVTSTLGLQYFFFGSSVPMDSLLQAGRGTLSVREGNEAEQAESDRRFLARNTLIRTDRTDISSQATITLSDATNGTPFVGSITLRGGTALRFDHASRPRFNWSSPNYDVEISEFFGKTDILIEDGLIRDIEVRITTQQGVEARLTASGRYVVEATDLQVKLTNYSGTAILIAPDRTTTSSIPPGEQGMIRVDENTIIRIPAPLNLLTNPELFTYSAEEVGGNIASQPIGWSCISTADEPPPGDIRADTAPDGRESWRLVRDNNARSHGETRCTQVLGDPQRGLGVSVENYNSMILRATVYVDHQSLSACGVVGTECPLMLTFDYISIDGRKLSRNWFQGIYARRDPGVDYPPSCGADCPRDHVFIYEKAWYTYESGNLFDLFPATERPVAVTDVSFYASGHQYDVYIDEVYLLVSNVSVPSTDTGADAGR